MKILKIAKRILLVILGIFVFFIIMAIVLSESDDSSNIKNAKEEIEITSEQNNISEEERELKNTEQNLISILKEKNAEIKNTTSYIKDNGIPYNFISFKCKNDYEVIEKIIDEVKKLNKKQIISLSISDNTNDVYLLSVTFSEDGSIELSESEQYNSRRKVWINSQFSGWDGSHIELTKLIKKNLNDGESYKHIKTTYIKVKVDEQKDKLNSILKEFGKTIRVEKNDLWVQTDFSAKNGFNATVKCTAIGIVNYNSNTVTLISIE